MTTIAPDLQTADPAPVDHRGGRRTDLVWRAAVVVAGTGSALLAGPALLTGSLTLVGVLLAAERLATMRRLGRLDALLVSIGGALSALVLVGLVLGSTALGLHRTTWTVALGAASLVALALAALTPARVAAQGPGPYRGDPAHTALGRGRGRRRRRRRLDVGAVGHER